MDLYLSCPLSGVLLYDLDVMSNPSASPVFHEYLTASKQSDVMTSPAASHVSVYVFLTPSEQSDVMTRPTASPVLGISDSQWIFELFN